MSVHQCSGQRKQLLGLERWHWLVERIVSRAFHSTYLCTPTNHLGPSTPFKTSSISQRRWNLECQLTMVSWNISFDDPFSYIHVFGLFSFIKLFSVDILLSPSFVTLIAYSVWLAYCCLNKPLLLIDLRRTKIATF